MRASSCLFDKKKTLLMTPKLKIPRYDFHPFISDSSFHPRQQIWGAGGAHFTASSDWKFCSAAAQRFSTPTCCHLCSPQTGTLFRGCIAQVPVMGLRGGGDAAEHGSGAAVSGCESGPLPGYLSSVSTSCSTSQNSPGKKKKTYVSGMETHAAA